MDNWSVYKMLSNYSHKFPPKPLILSIIKGGLNKLCGGVKDPLQTMILCDAKGDFRVI